VLSIPPDCRVRDAVSLMQDYGYSQVPVVRNGEVLGVFSFRSLAQETAGASLEKWTQQRCAPGDLRVDEFLEQFEFARVTEEMSRVFDAMATARSCWTLALWVRPRRRMGLLSAMARMQSTA
jgi:predicted transcriptional regulator